MESLKIFKQMLENNRNRDCRVVAIRILKIPQTTTNTFGLCSAGQLFRHNQLSFLTNNLWGRRISLRQNNSRTTVTITTYLNHIFYCSYVALHYIGSVVVLTSFAFRVFSTANSWLSWSIFCLCCDTERFACARALVSWPSLADVYVQQIHSK